MPKRIRIRIDTRFIETGRAGKAAKYLKSGEITVRHGIEVAIGCVFAPLGAVIQGADSSELEQISQKSRAQLETYINLAFNRCQSTKTFDLGESDFVKNNVFATEPIPTLEIINFYPSSQTIVDSSLTGEHQSPQPPPFKDEVTMTSTWSVEDDVDNSQNNIDIENEVL